jgi:hypothetical protein
VKEITHDLHHDLTFYCTQSIVCARVLGQCLEYLRCINLILYKLTFHLFSDIDKLLSGPSDAGGVCPEPAYQYREGGEDFCCCEHSCCWRRCAKSSPPVDCLQEIPNSRWIFNDQLGYYQAFSGT